MKVECWRETKQIVYPKAGRVKNDSYRSLFTVVLLLSSDLCMQQDSELRAAIKLYVSLDLSILGC